jgi:hypothetical protein
MSANVLPSFFFFGTLRTVFTLLLLRLLFIYIYKSLRSHISYLISHISYLISHISYLISYLILYYIYRDSMQRVRSYYTDQGVLLANI